MTTHSLPTAGALIIKDRKLLMTFSRNKECYYLPGGKLDAGESSAAALLRELQEELDITLTESDLQFETHITAPAYGEAGGTMMEQDCYMIMTDINPKPAAEIGALKYFRLMDYLMEEQQAPGAVMILKHLKQKGIID